MKKILLLHGWNWKNYTNQTTAKDAWNNREEFISRLSKICEVYKLNFPGFCGEPEPDKAWTLEDFAKYVHDYLNKNNLSVDYILGYSFGGAVAISYYKLYNPNQKLILISPAIVRNFTQSKNYFKTPSILKPLRDKIRNLYLIHIVKNNYMIHGSKFLNDTYQNIVREDLLDTVLKTNPEKLTIIYGENDNMVKPDYVINNLPEKYQKKIFIIKDGGHDIATTHTDELLDIIKNKSLKITKK